MQVLQVITYWLMHNIQGITKQIQDSTSGHLRPPTLKLTNSPTNKEAELYQ